MQTWSVGALPLHREPLLPCVAILCVDLSKHDKFVQVKTKACVEGREEDSSEERRTAGTGMLV